MKFFSLTLFFLTFLVISGMKSASNERVGRPFYEVAQAMYSAIPQEEVLVKTSLYEFVKIYREEKENAYEAPEVCWMFLGEWLTQNIAPSPNLRPWEREVVGIYQNIIDYKKYQ